MKHNRQPFTLIELLVVVAVIAVLASLLLPALSKSRAKAKTISCASNQKQLGTAFALYYDENDDRLPFGFWRDSAGTFRLSYDDLLNPYLGGNLTEAEKAAGSAPVTKGLKVLACPLDTYKRDLAPRTYSMPRTSPSNSGVGKFVAGSDNPPAPVMIGHISESSSTLLIAEWAGILTSSGVYNNQQGAQGSPLDSPQQQQLYPPLLHKLSDLNYLHCDGHVEALKPDATIGTGTIGSPKGIWTIAVGD